MKAVEQAALGGQSDPSLSASASRSESPAGHGQIEAERNAPLAKGILVVEDEAWIAIELQRVLADGGYEVVGLAADADVAVRLAGERRPGLVLMDIHLAGRGDGIDAAAQIRERFGVRSLFLSGHLDASTRRRAEATLPFAVLDKPITPKELLRAIAAALGGEHAY